MKRSVLKDATDQAVIDDGGGDGFEDGGSTFDPVAAANFSHPTGDVMARMAASLLTDFPLVAVEPADDGLFDSPQQLASAGRWRGAWRRCRLGPRPAATATGRCRAP